MYVIKILDHYFFPYCIKTECFFKTIVYFLNFFFLKNKDVLLNSIPIYSEKKKGRFRIFYDNIYNLSKIIYKLKFRVSIYD